MNLIQHRMIQVQDFTCEIKNPHMYPAFQEALTW